MQKERRKGGREKTGRKEGGKKGGSERDKESHTSEMTSGNLDSRACYSVDKYTWAQAVVL